MKSLLSFFLCVTVVLARRCQAPKRLLNNSTSIVKAKTGCFPSLGFETPSSVPKTTSGWWCDESSEYAFMGFSYEVSACQSLSELRKDFEDMRNTFNARYFGFDGDDEWKSRRNSLFKTLHSNPKAKFVTRAVQFGSEPLFDNAISASQLASQVKSARSSLLSLGIKVTVSDMAYGYQARGGAQNVLDAVDFLDVHMLPFFSQSASTASKAWPILMKDQNWFASRAKGKKMYWSENGWPSTTSSGVKANSPKAVADNKNEKAYYQLLDSHCSDFKSAPGGGVGWFWHIYSDEQEPGYGLYNDSGDTKFDFKPRTSC